MPSDMLQTTPGFFTAAIAAADENENPFETSFKAGNAAIEHSKEQQLLEEGAHRDSNSFLRALDGADFSPLFGFSPRTSPAPAPYINTQFLSSGNYNSMHGSGLPPASAWPGAKAEKPHQFAQGPVIYRQEPSPPNSADRSPENWLFTDYPLQQPVHSPLHAILTQNIPQETRTQYGQATPPDDRTPVIFEHQHALQRVHPSKEQASVTIGKRKRTLPSTNDVAPAAPAKRSRKNAKSGSPDRLSMQDKHKPEDAKRSKFLERNRVAASKCRQKKKEWTSNLETRARELQNSKNQLAIMVGSLKEEVLFLKSELLRHTGCGCSKIRDYLSQEVSALAGPGTSGVFKSAASPVRSAPSSRAGSVSPAANHEESRSASGDHGDHDTYATSPVGEQVLDDDDGPASPPTKFKTEDELEALLTSQLLQDTSDEGIAARSKGAGT
ncbi:MAG: hypothetical protein LQ347_006302 [Umbilicaria vellea]|nr:MAG: hypothetical protein LQ347_006302 [Umbilicaria vellea]